jgi:ribose-phosphate pyrophosphokinase
MPNVKVFSYDTGEEIPVKFSTFPAGERYVKLMDTTKHDRYKVILLSASSEAIIDVLLVQNAIENNNSNAIVVLVADYLPYSRQDRVCSLGESFSLKVMLDILNKSFDEIQTIDVHNKSSVDGYNVYKRDVDFDGFFIDCKDKEVTKLSFNQGVVVAPDKGAVDRCLMASKALFKNDNVILFDKQRLENGIVTKVNESSLEMLKTASKLIVVDDICDGGGTFLALAKSIREHNPTAELILVVTHGIFSQGFDNLLKHYSEIYCCNHDYNRARLEIQ